LIFDEYTINVEKIIIYLYCFAALIILLELLTEDAMKINFAKKYILIKK